MILFGILFTLSIGNTLASSGDTRLSVDVHGLIYEAALQLVNDDVIALELATCTPAVVSGAARHSQSDTLKNIRLVLLEIHQNVNLGERCKLYRRAMRLSSYTYKNYQHLSLLPEKTVETATQLIEWHQIRYWSTLIKANNGKNAMRYAEFLLDRRDLNGYVLYGFAGEIAADWGIKDGVMLGHQIIVCQNFGICKNRLVSMLWDSMPCDEKCLEQMAAVWFKDQMTQIEGLYDDHKKTLRRLVASVARIKMPSPVKDAILQRSLEQQNWAIAAELLLYTVRNENPSLQGNLMKIVQGSGEVAFLTPDRVIFLRALFESFTIQELLPLLPSTISELNAHWIDNLVVGKIKSSIRILTAFLAGSNLPYSPKYFLAIEKQISLPICNGLLSCRAQFYEWYRAHLEGLMETKKEISIDLDATKMDHESLPEFSCWDSDCKLPIVDLIIY